MKKPRWKVYGALGGWRWIPRFSRRSLGWKDKWDNPVHEWSPSVRIEWLFFSILFLQGEDEQEWEQYLWTTIWCDGDEELAKETWEWVDMDTHESTWKDYK